MLNCFCVGIGGFFGSILRYLIGLLPINFAFPIKTLFINLTGTIILGLINLFLAKNKILPQHILLMLKLGLCGGFTTFSTFAYEIAALIQNGAIMSAIIYVFLSIVLATLALLISIK